MIAALTLGLLWTGCQDPPRLYDGLSLFDYVIGTPTGKNGYEEFVRAASSVRPGDFQKILSLPTFGTPHFLSGQRQVAGDAARYESGIRAGLTKSVFYPKPNPTFVTMTPEFADFKTMQKTLAASAHGAFADGQPLAACNTISTGLDFASKVGATGGVIEYLVGLNMQTVMTQVIARSLDQVPLEGAKALEAAATRALQVSGLPGAFDCELQMEADSVRRLIPEPRRALIDMGVKAEDIDAVPQPGEHNQFGEWCQFPESKRKFLAESAILARRALYESEKARFEKPESEWAKQPRFIHDSKATEALIVVPLLMTTAIPSYDDFFESELRRRTALRLLRLHCRIIQYRWTHGALPSTVQELGDRKVTVDPLTGREFVYRPKGSDYTLWSEGDRYWGKLYLEYTKPVENEDNGQEGGPQQR